MLGWLTNGDQMNKLIQRILRTIWPPLDPIQRAAPFMTGFYGSDRLQPAEVADFTTLHWESFFFGEPSGIDSILEAKKPTVIDLRCMWGSLDGKFFLLPEAETNLRMLFVRLAAAGALQYVWALYPIDEPNTTVAIRLDIRLANIICRTVASEFPELAGVKLAVIFSGFDDTPCIEDYDLVGGDAYSRREKIFDVSIMPWPPKSDYDRLVSRLRPDQQAIIVPGGGDPWRQDPAAFFAKASQDGRIALVLAFLWIDRSDSGPTHAGIRNNGMAEHYGKLAGHASA